MLTEVWLHSVVSRPSKGMPVANQHSVPAPARRVSTTLAGRSKIAREASVARHPSDQFVIHLDGHTSDEDTDGEESGQESQNGSLRTVSELHRIKSTVEALRLVDVSLPKSFAALTTLQEADCQSRGSRKLNCDFEGVSPSSQFLFGAPVCC